MSIHTRFKCRKRIALEIVIVIGLREDAKLWLFIKESLRKRKERNSRAGEAECELCVHITELCVHNRVFGNKKILSGF